MSGTKEQRATFQVSLDSGRVVRNPNGTITVPARVARSGLQTYPHGVAYRPVEEVTDAESLASLRHVAVTVGHPPGGEVTADNWQQYAVGFTVGEPRVVRLDSATDGHGETFIEADLLITDAKTIQRILDRELTELSSGYRYQPELTEGALDGNTYKFVQRKIRHNHVALLEDGGARAGRLARVALDSQEKHVEEELKRIKAELDSMKAEREADREKIKKLEADKAKVDAELAAEKQKQAAEDAIEAEVEERLALREAVGVLVKGEYPFGKMKPAEVHRAVLNKMYPGKIAADASDDYLRARFDAEVEQRKNAKPVIAKPQTSTGGTTATDSTNMTPYQAHVARLQGLNKHEAK